MAYITFSLSLVSDPHSHRTDTRSSHSCLQYSWQQQKIIWTTTIGAWTIWMRFFFFFSVNMQQTKHSFIRRLLPGRTILRRHLGTCSHYFIICRCFSAWRAVFHEIRNCCCHYRATGPNKIADRRTQWNIRSKNGNKNEWRRCLIVNSKREISIISMALCKRK